MIFMLLLFIFFTFGLFLVVNYLSQVAPAYGWFASMLWWTVNGWVLLSALSGRAGGGR